MHTPPLRRHTLGDLLHRSAARHPHKPAIACGDVRWTYAQFDALCDRLAAGLAGLNAWRDHQDALAADEEIAQQAAEVEEIDAKVLTSDLPMKALLDEDFQAWLKKPAQPAQD